jgi:hypothetical protein
LDEDFLSFYKPIHVNRLQKQKEQADDVLEKEVRGEQISIGQLPSFTKLCLNVIVLPEEGTCKKVVKPDTVIPIIARDINDKKRRY